MEAKNIVVRGARQHNLKNIDVSIPRDQLVVITGLSGSGKSSLAFDTLYAEGQRRYVESLSAYARQFLDQMGKPDVDTIEGLSPAISIEQKKTSNNPRSTVGTVTELYDYLRLLFARVGEPSCYRCSQPITMQTVSQMVDQIMQLKLGTKLNILAPVVSNRKGEFSRELQNFKKQGFVRARIDGETYDLADEIQLDKKKKHNLDLFIDRLILKEGIESRVADSLETALRQAHGLAKVEALGGETMIFSERFACVTCGVSYPEINPQMFSFNNPVGACDDCKGLGSRQYFDPNCIIKYNLSLREGAIVPWTGRGEDYYWNQIEKLAKHFKFDVHCPFKDLPKKVQKIILDGSSEKFDFSFDMGDRLSHYTAEFEGVLPNLNRRYRDSESDSARDELEKYLTIQECPTCKGARLRPEALAIKINEKNIDHLTQLSIEKALKWFEQLGLSKKQEKIAERILKEIKERLVFMNNVGLGYLSLDRRAGTLSGGEAQRIRLATQIGSSLVGVLYILDEPSIGLHQRDNDRLIATLNRLRDLGNTVLVVEHDENTIQAADYVIDMGPGAGTLGGRVVAEGTPDDIVKHPRSLTGHYLSGRKSIAVPSKRRGGHGTEITLLKASGHNLKDLTLKLPLGKLICVTGVSGSGKSTLINDTLYRGLAHRLNGARALGEPHEDITGLEHIDKIINIDQSPIGRTPRSNPATYTGVLTPIRELFSGLPDAKMQGYKPGRFSFNVKGGRCEACEGDGILKIEMHFLPDVYVECEVCRGMRYNRETLEIHYRTKNIADILKMTVKEAFTFFENIPNIKNKLQTLLDVGLGYIELGQSATTLSGGEAQRIKLSKELSRRSTGKTIYLLDEPTTGLHFADIDQLLHVLHRLVDGGNTVLIIEHNIDVIKTADWVIDLGPEGGDKGGQLVAEGTPEEVAACAKSYTGQYLREVLPKLKQSA
jgi:excinuclease ABC subunit A